MKKNKHLHGWFTLSIEVYLVVIGLFFIVSVSSNQLQAPSARITLTNLERGHVRTVTSKVNHEVVLTVPTRYFEAYFFECNASYPVEWNYIGEGAPTTTADVGRHFKDFYDVNSYTYQSILYMYNLEEMQTGRYLCRGSNPEHEKLQIHYDLFVPGNGSRTLISIAEKELFIPESKPMTAIPCAVTDPTAVINLYKGNSWGTFQKLEVNESIIFRPRKGFVLKMHELPDPFGTYMCTTQNNQKRRKIHLIPEHLKSKYNSNANHLNGKIAVELTYDHEYNRVMCCTGTTFVPKLQWAGCVSVLDCQIKSMCFEEDRCEFRLGFGVDVPKPWVDPGSMPKGCAAWKLRDDPNGDHGIFKCSTPGVSQYQPYLLNRGNIFLDFDKAPGSEMILSLTKTKDEPIYVGSEVEYHCNSTRFYFAYGIRWAFQRGNGDIEFVEDESVIRDRYFLTAHRRQTTFKIQHADIKGIICFVPIANSPTEWRTVSLPITVKESFNIQPLHHESGQLSHKDYISNVIPYTSQPDLFEPYSTSRPKGYFNYQTESDPQVPNIDLSEVISIKEEQKTSPATLPLVQPQILHDAQDRDYNLHSFPKQSQPQTLKQIPTIGPQYQHQHQPRIKSGHVIDEHPYLSSEGRPDVDYPTYQRNSPNSQEPLISSGDHLLDRNPGGRLADKNQRDRLIDRNPDDRFVERNPEGLSIESNPGDRSIERNAGDRLVDRQPLRVYPQPPPTNRPTVQPTPVEEPLPSFESEDRDYIRHSDLKHSQNFAAKLTSNSNGRPRNHYKKYSSTTKKPPPGYYSYEVNNNDPQIPYKSVEEYKLLKSSPPSIPQSVIHYDPHQKGFSLRPQSPESKELHRKYPTEPSHTQHSQYHISKSDHLNQPSHTQHYHKSNDHSSRYQPPTQSTHSFNDPYVSGSIPISKTILAPQQESSPSGSQYANDYYTTSLRLKQQRRQQRIRTTTTTMSPYYYNYNQTAQSSYPSSASWEREREPLLSKGTVEYSREYHREVSKPASSPPPPPPAQYHILRDKPQPPPQSTSVQTDDQSRDQSRDGTDENYYFHRYAAESKEFPAAVQQSRSRVRPTMHTTYNDDNAIRRSGYSYGDSVPLVELG